MNRTVITVLIGIVLSLAAWFAYDRQRPTPPQPLSEMMDASPMVQVTVPELAGNQIVGQQIFEAKCAACHGQNAAGQDGVAPPLIHRIYEPSHHGDAAFLRAVQSGVRPHHWRFGPMPPVEGLTPADVAMIVDYIRALQRANGI